MERASRRGIVLGLQSLDFSACRSESALQQLHRRTITPKLYTPTARRKISIQSLCNSKQYRRSEQHGNPRGGSWRVGIAAAVGATTVAVNSSPDSDGSSKETPTVAPAESVDAPLFTFGAIADVQYADMDDQWDFSKTQIRQYRGALEILRAAVCEWNTMPQISFIANLGDIIDGHNNGLKESQVALDRVLGEFNLIAHDIPVAHLIGNHELYNFTIFLPHQYDHVEGRQRRQGTRFPISAGEEPE
eukprot:m.1383994 g.1383994  ORF g.1383994 m.1383994 type:complete len:246 (+) comp24973_c0_seq128:352-1089(+)